VSGPLVVLLRASEGSDPYALALARAGFETAFRPVLRYTFINGEALVRRLEHPDLYESLVLTSPRAVAAIAARGGPRSWTGSTVYAVGPATAAAASDLGLSVRGQEAHDGASLADVILQDERQGPVLFLCGNRRRDVLPRALRKAGVDVEELVVYRTDIAPPERPPDDAKWAVFFSPSGVEAALASPDFPWNSLRTAAIGPATAEALHLSNHPPSAVASEPSPEGLVAALAGA
jgi:uroporphyrinogen-III synthase